MTQVRPTIDQRKSIVRKLAKIEASQRQIARTLGVDESTIRADHRAGNPAPTQKKPNETKAPDTLSAGNPAPAPDSGIAAATRLAEKDKRPRSGNASHDNDDEWYTPANFVSPEHEVEPSVIRHMRAVHSKLTDTQFEARSKAVVN